MSRIEWCLESNGTFVRYWLRTARLVYVGAATSWRACRACLFCCCWTQGRSHGCLRCQTEPKTHCSIHHSWSCRFCVELSASIWLLSTYYWARSVLARSHADAKTLASGQIGRVYVCRMGWWKQTRQLSSQRSSMSNDCRPVEVVRWWSRCGGTIAWWTCRSHRSWFLD